MKVRNGFVSNSSSSSYVVLLPENFDVESVKDKGGWRDYPEKDIIEDLKFLAQGGVMLHGESYDLHSGVWALGAILDDYIVARVEGGPDDSSITSIDRKKINKILGVTT